MKFLAPILIVGLLLFPFIAQAGFMDVLGSIIGGIICLTTGLLCPDPCLTLGTGAAYGLCKLVDRITQALYVIGWGLAIVILLWGGISIMVSGGNEEQLKKGKQIIKQGLIGAAIVVCSGFILSLLLEFLAPLFNY
jgi:hypothetical protein